VRSAPLLPGRLHRAALVLAALCWAGMALLGAHFAGDDRPGPFDARLMARIHAAFGHRGMPGELLVGPTDAVVVVGFVLLGLALARWRRSPPLAGFVLAGPLLGELIGDGLLKPVFGRTYGPVSLSYPSGHTIAAVTTLTALLLIVLGSRRIAVRVLAGLVWLVLIVSLALGLVILDFHYPTDVVGGFLLAVGTVLPLAVLTDRLDRRRLDRRRLDRVPLSG
jgi:membrane-associated phospholipid phosphatase